MTLYVGETTRIRSTANDFDDNPLTDADVTSVKLDVTRKSDSAVILSNITMTWDSTHEYWYYDWVTNTATPIAAGAYRAKVTYFGLNFETWEFKDLRFKANPV